MAEHNMAYPLQWPSGRPRRPAAQRRRAAFKTFGERLNVDAAIRRLRAELDRLRARDFVLSTNQELRKDGWPRADRTADDPAVAVYFTLGRKPMCMPCDTYDRMPDNIAAVALHIRATRAIERYGVASVEEMFAGFLALPPPGRPWRVILGFGEHDVVGQTAVEAAYREQARKHHPDAGGSNAAMAELNAARAAARQELGDG